MHVVQASEGEAVKFIYEVVCTYEVEAENKAAALRVAKRIASGLARTGITRASGPDGAATQIRTAARPKPARGTK